MATQDEAKIYDVVKSQCTGNHQRLKLVRESDDEFPNAQTLFRKLTPFSFESMKKATNNFNPNWELRNFRFSRSYKGILDDGSQVAVMVYSDYRFMEFMTSMIRIMSGVKHKNVVEAIGYCIEGDHKILVHDFVGENSLYQLLFSDDVLLDWPTRVSICHGIAGGLDYLHNAINPGVVHGNINPSNILLDGSFNPKIANFESSCLLNEVGSLISFHSGEMSYAPLGYCGPEFYLTGRSEKTDVYAFGITLSEIVSGTNNFLFLRDHDQTRLVDWAWNLRESGRIFEFVDQRLSDFSEDEVTRLVNVAIACAQRSSDLRPSMSEVRLMLSDSYDYSNMVPPDDSIIYFPLDSPQQQMSSDSEVSLQAPNSVGGTSQTMMSMRSFPQQSQSSSHNAPF